MSDKIIVPEETKQERLAKLEQDLKLAKAMIENNSHWSANEKNTALFGFCFGKVYTDILYQIACMSGRHESIDNELERLISNLKEDNDGQEAQK